ncbi:GtrA family protein [Oscillatoria amoena NRMC-F 0135]|nr:GtrA family protein [Geitlerinema splendidum]MDL5046839.1 GtrA family protein [Oscillatoria amoena NRMC-F 0135]
MQIRKLKVLLKGFSRYPLYFVIGGIISLFVIVLREFLERFISTASTSGYSLSVIVAYGVGNLLSFVLHSKITFYTPYQQTLKQKLKQLLAFGANCLLSLVLTVVFSVGIRQFLFLFFPSEGWINTLAFGSAAIGTSMITYLLNKMIFRPPAQ